MSLNPNDIPEALRDRPALQTSSRLAGFPSGLGLLGLGLMALVLGIIWLGRGAIFPPAPVVLKPSPTPAALPTPSVENVLGHLPYAVVPESELRAVTRDGSIRLHRLAAEAFTQMQSQAKARGISLVPLSGFRSLEQQNNLFFKVKQQRNQETRERAEVSAPPGYSEHHTGYAVDIGDGAVPSTNLSQSFEQTAAFEWLRQNAHRFSFEMSFPPDNPQGVSYEPWHWRYVGDRTSLETFYKARQLPSRAPSP